MSSKQEVESMLSTQNEKKKRIKFENIAAEDTDVFPLKAKWLKHQCWTYTIRKLLNAALTSHKHTLNCNYLYKCLSGRKRQFL